MPEDVSAASAERHEFAPASRHPYVGLGVKGGCRRQVDGTAGLPSAPEMPCAPRQLRLAPNIGIGGHLAMPPLPHHRAYGSGPWRFDWVKLEQSIPG